MKGKTKYSHNVNTDSFKKRSAIDFDIKDGDMDLIRSNGSPSYNTHTGQIPAYYVEHLRQLLHARKMWLLDTDLQDIEVPKYRFKKIICKTASLDIRTDDPGPDGIAITYEHAWLDDGYNVF